MKNNTLYATLRSFARNTLLDVLGTFARPAIGIHILNGHRIEEEAEPHTFRTLLQQLSPYVTFIRIEEAVRMIVAKEQPSKPLVAFTFDDGFMECYDIFAPVLEEFNVNALFFVNPNYVEADDDYIVHFNQDVVDTPHRRPMRWHHLRELSARGHIIGAHTMDHYMINTDDKQTLEYQIITCKHIIEQQLAKECKYFAFPYGKLSQANLLSIDMACKTYPYVFSQSDYRHYYSFDGRVINRRHFEPFWTKKHLFYFLSCRKRFE